MGAQFSAAWGALFFGLLSAASWGTGDFCGGLASRQGRAHSVVMVAEFVGALLLALLAWFTGEARPTWPIALGAAGAGLVGLIGLLALYTGLAAGQMGLVAPLSAVIAALVPIVTALFLQGLPPLAQIAGFALALIAVWLLAGTGEIQATRQQLGLALVAGLGFGFYFVLVEQVSREGVFWPLTIARTVAGLALLAVLLVRRAPVLPHRPAWTLAVVAGLFDAGGNLFFALAAQSGRLDVASVLSSLYPGMTVVLAWVVLNERLNRPQIVGVVAALAAVVLIAL